MKYNIYKKICFCGKSLNVKYMSSPYYTVASCNVQLYCLLLQEDFSFLKVKNKIKFSTVSNDIKNVVATDDAYWVHLTTKHLTVKILNDICFHIVTFNKMCIRDRYEDIVRFVKAQWKQRLGHLERTDDQCKPKKILSSQVYKNGKSCLLYTSRCV